jgi:2-deoxy-D-gluconate 3-dehydrogenase
VDASVFGLEGKVALVIGAGQGMGEASSRLLAGAGCDLALVDVDAGRAEGIAAQVRELGRRALPIVADVYDTPRIAEVVERTVDELGRVEVLVNIIGFSTFVPLLEMDEATWDLDHQRCVRYVFLTAQAVARRMVAAGHGGAIVSIASVSGLRGAPYHAAYGSAKAGLMSLTRSMAIEWAPYGIRANAIAPGSIQTPRSPLPERSGIPLVRRGQPLDIARAVLFLASDLSAYITGHTIPVDGGATAKFPMGDPAPWRSEIYSKVP